MKYSILIPTYNNSEGCLKAIYSVLNQTNIQDYEILICDDGSTDSTLEQLNENFSEHNKVKYYSRNNKGVSVTRNELIEKSRGEFILFLDSDDTFDSNLLDVIDKVLRIDDFDYLRFNRTRQYFSNGILTETYNENNDNDESLIKYYIDKTFANYSTLYDKGFVKNVHCGVFKSSIIKENNIKFNQNLKYAEDTVFCINYLGYTARICKINKSLYLYNKVDEINATSKFNESLVNGVYAIDEAESLLLSNSKDSVKFSAKMRKLTRLINVYNHPKNHNKLGDKAIKIRTSSIYKDILNVKLSNAVLFLLKDKKMLVIYLLLKIKMLKLVILISKKMYRRSIV